MIENRIESKKNTKKTGTKINWYKGFQQNFVVPFKWENKNSRFVRTFREIFFKENQNYD